MKLRHKFGVLALIYVLSLSANLIMSGWCIVVYFQSAFIDVQSSFVRQTEIERLRVPIQVARTRYEFQKPGQTATLPASTLAPLRAAVATRLIDESIATSDPNETVLWRNLSDALAASSPRLPAELLRNCDSLLGQISALITTNRRDAIDHAARTQQRVVKILIYNAIVGAALCVAGLVLVRRWVLVPVAGLRVATQQIAEGHFDYRIEPRSADELGKLAGEVNQMSATIVDMQAKLIEQERQAAAGEMFRRIAHNTRNPLAGIRGLAEATRRQDVSAEDIDEYQHRIIKAIDRLEQWLRDLQHAVEPMNIDPQRTDLAELVENVCNVLVPMADRVGVHIVAMIDPVARYAVVDGFHFEQALVALITNAVQASQKNQTVRIRVTPDRDHADQWCVVVEDEGSGIPDDLKGKIFLPDFTTRAEGSGLGLPMVAKVIHTHGGSIHCESTLGSGSRFEAIMPGRATEEQ
ncbi:MAG: HAMP domain-containing histidine kinase [Planctomycetes bacterium]|nr:HAMP domain-containing histidine kinase [Planctomycetota bacterium]